MTLTPHYLLYRLKSHNPLLDGFCTIRRLNGSARTACESDPSTSTFLEGSPTFPVPGTHRPPVVLLPATPAIVVLHLDRPSQAGTLSRPVPDKLGPIVLVFPWLGWRRNRLPFFRLAGFTNLGRSLGSLLRLSELTCPAVRLISVSKDRVIFHRTESGVDVKISRRGGMQRSIGSCSDWLG
ncbi:hypothetical protein BO78DRAFT_397222 [Aspergillus sclerotiicarbonarius CBS 121057]|uniref:Uncharacterized protein n=1 Tax=Aspergillus sclerotiicarbonarius (strain CBS 121057 / IBT 28362) TaxID=1448318 RepID=A0A319EFK5_ASPSB|nr:hypothetical protein BO78DRAFT_397222 [Aspergillus sclerotiicarbonarius CBS 121057]